MRRLAVPLILEIGELSDDATYSALLVALARDAGLVGACRLATVRRLALLSRWWHGGRRVKFQNGLAAVDEWRRAVENGAFRKMPIDSFFDEEGPDDAMIATTDADEDVVQVAMTDALTKILTTVVPHGSLHMNHHPILNAADETVGVVSLEGVVFVVSRSDKCECSADCWCTSLSSLNIFAFLCSDDAKPVRLLQMTKLVGEGATDETSFDTLLLASDAVAAKCAATLGIDPAALGTLLRGVVLALNLHLEGNDAWQLVEHLAYDYYFSGSRLAFARSFPRTQVYVDGVPPERHYSPQGLLVAVLPFLADRLTPFPLSLPLLHTALTGWDSAVLRKSRDTVSEPTFILTG